MDPCQPPSLECVPSLKGQIASGPCQLYRSFAEKGSLQMSSSQMSPTADLTTLCDAIQRGDEATLVALYAGDAQLTIVDRTRPPSKPTVLADPNAIASYYHDVCGRAMTHTVEQTISGPDGIAFTEACRYADGTRVLSANLLTLRDGKIARHL